MDSFLNRLKAQAAAQDQTIGQPRFGLVASVDPASYTARVRLMPEDVLSGWLPILSLWIGAGWGLAVPPSPGDQVLVLAQEGDGEQGVILGGAFSGPQPPPSVDGTNAPSGELWLVHRSGSYLRLRNDGSIDGQASQWNLTGDLHVTGDVYDRHGALSALRGHYDVHTHPLGGGGNTGAPSPQD